MKGHKKFLYAVQAAIIVNAVNTHRPSNAALHMLKAIELSDMYKSHLRNANTVDIANDVSDFIRWINGDDRPEWIVTKIGFPD